WSSSVSRSSPRRQCHETDLRAMMPARGNSQRGTHDLFDECGGGVWGRSGVAPPQNLKMEPIQTATGLEYVEIVEGTGAQPKPGDSVSVHYTGWLKSGQKFDSSHDRGQPLVFPLGRGRVIKGWDEGVASMKVGGKRKLIIPAHLAYGDRGAGGVIPPGATLIFEVELVGIG